MCGPQVGRHEVLAALAAAEPDSDHQGHGIGSQKDSRHARSAIIVAGVKCDNSHGDRREHPKQVACKDSVLERFILLRGNANELLNVCFRELVLVVGADKLYDLVVDRSTRSPSNHRDRPPSSEKAAKQNAGAAGGYFQCVHEHAVLNAADQYVRVEGPLSAPLFYTEDGPHVKFSGSFLHELESQRMRSLANRFSRQMRDGTGRGPPGVLLGRFGKTNKPPGDISGSSAEPVAASRGP